MEQQIILDTEKTLCQIASLARVLRTIDTEAFAFELDDLLSFIAEMAEGNRTKLTEYYLAKRKAGESSLPCR